MNKNINYGKRKVIEKQRGYFFLMLPTAYVRTFGIGKGSKIELNAKHNGTLILKVVKND